MKRYTKKIDGKTVVKSRNQIVVKETKTVVDKDGNEKEKTYTVYNPSEELLLRDGWVEYVEPVDIVERRELMSLKRLLTNTDYKVIKCMEAMMMGETMPYVIEDLHEERQGYRDRINEIESNLSSM